MESVESLPLATALAVHAAGVVCALLCRLPLSFAPCLMLRTALLASGVAISGLAIQSCHHGFGNWVFSALTLGVMIILAVLHTQQDDVDLTLSRVVAAHRPTAGEAASI